MGTVTFRVRSLMWFATGVVITLLATVVVLQAWRVDAAPGDSDTTFVPITPGCRFADTRQAGQGPAIGPGQVRTFTAHGTNNACTIPNDAVGLLMNITVDSRTAPNSFLTVWGNGNNPGTSALNPAAGQPPTPNSVTTDLTPAGQFKIYNDAGFVNVIIDINGYYTKTSLTELASRLTAAEAKVAANETGIAALDAAQPFTVASEPINNVLALSTATEVRSITVQAPVAGHVAVVASGYMIASSDGSVVECGLMDSVTEPPLNVKLQWESPTGGDLSHLSASRVFDIAAGATATYYLVCLNESSPSFIVSPQVTAIFTPAP